MKKTAHNSKTTVESLTSGTLDTLGKAMHTTEQEIEHVVAPIRESVLRRFPMLFLLAVTFGVTAVTTGMQQIMIQYQILESNPWLILLLGLTTLIVTGTIYNKLG